MCKFHRIVLALSTVAGLTICFWGIGADNIGLVSAGAVYAGLAAGWYGGWSAHEYALQRAIASWARKRAEQIRAERARVD